MNRKCLKCARYHETKGFATCRDGYQIIWGVIIQNLSAELGLTDEQTARLVKISDEMTTARLVKISDEMTTVLMGADGMDMTPDEFAEYLEAKARECADRLRGNWGVRA